MSYVHCPACQRAYNLATHRVCPGCPPADATSEIVAAAEQLALAIARATPGELAAAGTRLDRLALPSGAEPRALPSSTDDREAWSRPADSQASTGAKVRSVLSSIRAALRPEPPPPGAQQALLATVALALISRLAAPPRRSLAAHAATWSTRARALLARF